MRDAICAITRQLTKADELYIDLSKIDSATVITNYTIFFKNSILYRLFRSEVVVFPFIAKGKNYIEYQATDSSFIDYLFSLSNVNYFEVNFGLKIIGDKEYLFELFDYLKNSYTDLITLSNYTEVPECNVNQICLFIKSKSRGVATKNYF